MGSQCSQTLGEGGKLVIVLEKHYWWSNAHQASRELHWRYYYTPSIKAQNFADSNLSRHLSLWLVGDVTFKTIVKNGEQREDAWLHLSSVLWNWPWGCQSLCYGNCIGYLSMVMSWEAGPPNWFKKYCATGKSISALDIQTWLEDLKSKAPWEENTVSWHDADGEHM